jgi:23S rRNA (uridine2552-2'-O)-methyltransferase
LYVAGNRGQVSKSDRQENMNDHGSGRGGERVRVRSVKGRTASSRRWLERQLNDPYVHAAKTKGYRSRAAFKLLELDSKFHFLKKGSRILDLGAAPGGWSQVAVQRAGDRGQVVGIDVLEMEPIVGVRIFHGDLTDPDMAIALKAALTGPADVVLSDMAASTTGHRATDHLRTTALLETALDLAEDVLGTGGVFVGKVFQGGATGNLLARIKKRFGEVRHVKPPASRSESVELYLVAQGFKGER